MVRLLALLIFLSSALAQAPLPGQPTTPFLPNEWMGAGGAWNQASHPQVAGWASYARLISAPAGLYSFTSWDLTIRPKGVANAGTSQSSTRTGMALLLRQLGPVSLLGLGDAGAAIPANGLAGAFSGGGIVVFKLGKWNLTLELAARVLKVSGQPNQTIYELGFGRTSQ